ncbi:flippase activity-associated protein Agl23 [Haladaptatus caseinilyticus]|uniref:flippase activity-associated protein Agl23 n=1 Tax=Haladaptatus caseinilyticus TaxID=2993314 RepID=UPI00224B7463|nr:flippase activity-associated protein Agl23 [Haladaptatus caseinilyticus]
MQGSDTAQKRSRSLPFTSSDESGVVSRFANPVPLVVLITAFGLFLRLVNLGARVAHQDEARVAYWMARYAENGIWFYRKIVHGPFFFHVNSTMFSLFGANDFIMRLVVALMGGCLPLAALLFRKRLRPSETVALAALFALNPLLLYYSRFLRNDVPLAMVMVFAFGFFVRFADTRKLRYVFAGVAFFALGFTMKENALLYAACWVGAGALIYDHRLFLRRVGNDGIAGAIPPGLRNWVRTNDSRAITTTIFMGVGVALLAVLEFLTVIVFFYAPRSQTRPGIGLWKSLSNPTTVPELIHTSTVGTWEKFISWSGHTDHAYLPYLGDSLQTLKVGGLALCLLAVVGFLVDRYSGDRPNDVVAFGFYWGVASVLGYPIVMDIKAGWAMVHAIVPLAFPAAVGLALVFRWGREGYERRDDVSLAAAVVLLLLVSAQVGATAYDTSYQNPQSPDNQFVQYAQSSSGEAKPLLHDLQRISRRNDGPDVMFFGEELYSPDESDHEVPPAGQGWFDRLPLAWYFEAADANVVSTNEPTDLRGAKPPIVVTLNNVSTCNSEDGTAEDIDQYMAGYEAYEFQRFAYDSGCTVSSMTIYVDKDEIDDRQ